MRMHRRHEDVEDAIFARGVCIAKNPGGFLQVGIECLQQIVEFWRECVCRDGARVTCSKMACILDADEGAQDALEYGPKLWVFVKQNVVFPKIRKRGREPGVRRKALVAKNEQA